MGNGEFCFSADGTGLQTLGGNSMSHWGWRSFPLPTGWTADQVPQTGTFQQGRNKGPDIFPEASAALRQWMFDNPHILNLGRLRLCRADGASLAGEDITGLTRTLDLWSGVQTSTFRVEGEPVRVETCVPPLLDAVVLRIESPLLASGALKVALDFPYPTLRNDAWVGNFAQVGGHQTEMFRPGERRADFQRVVDTTTYYASVAWLAGAMLIRAENSPHRFTPAARALATQLGY